ncbi:MAG: serine/threonine protein kinase [Bdellovibrionales bacterium]|nr:serine/threonine protein kinase [Bdellovibrionales bacterium]
MSSENINLDDNSLPIGFKVAGRYRILERLGKGGMGCVYLAADAVLGDELVAIKVLHPDYFHDRELMQRFLREVQLMRRVSHRNVVRTYDVGSDEGLAYFTMEYVPGTPLDKIIQNSTYPKAKIAELSLQTAEALHAIHRAGVVHRDLKPGNILVLNDGTIRITDFGVARPETSDMTAHNEILGSVCYIAPEIWLGEAPSPSVDLYSLGIILYELITGDVPFDGGSPAELMRLHLERKPTPPNELDPSTPQWLNKLVLKLLEKSPRDRFQSAQELIDYLKTHLDRGSSSSKDTGSFINDLEVKSQQLLQVVEPPEPVEPATLPPRPTRARKPTVTSPARHSTQRRLQLTLIQLLRGALFVSFGAAAFGVVHLLLDSLLPDVTTPQNGSEPPATSTVLLTGAIRSFAFLLSASLLPVALTMACRAWREVWRAALLSIVFATAAGAGLVGLHYYAASQVDPQATGPALLAAGIAAKEQLSTVILFGPHVVDYTASLTEGALRFVPTQAKPLLRAPLLLALQFGWCLVLVHLVQRALRSGQRSTGKLSWVLVLGVLLLTLIESLLLAAPEPMSISVPLLAWRLPLQNAVLGALHWALLFVVVLVARHRQ